MSTTQSDTQAGAMRSSELGELATALCAAQAEFTAVPKNSTNPFFKSSYAGLPEVVKAASPILTKHGLSISQFLGIDEHGFDTLTTWLLHKSGQFIADSMRLHLTKDDAQGHGSATTYARRYSYMAVLGLVADEDDDGNQASRRQDNGAQRSTPSAAQPQQTARAATAKQRGLINARANAASLESSVLANIILVATGNEPREWSDDEQAQEWLKRGMDRLPASAVDPVLENIEAEAEAMA